MWYPRLDPGKILFLCKVSTSAPEFLSKKDFIFSIVCAKPNVYRPHICFLSTNHGERQSLGEAPNHP